LRPSAKRLLTKGREDLQQGQSRYRYPRRVRTLALDGALDHSLSEPAMLGAGGRAAEDVFNR
jgi:hypothetical protein